MNEIAAIIYLNALAAGINPHLAISVAVVESNLNPAAIGLKGDVGLFQVRHELVEESFFDLLNLDKNIRAGLRVLAHAKRGCNNFEDKTWVVCYNRGVTGAKRVVNKKNDAYYRKVNNVYNCLKQHGYKSIRNTNVVRTCSLQK